MKNFIFRLKKALLLFWITVSRGEVDSKLFRKYVSLYFYEEYNSEIISCFTDVKIFEEKTKFTLQITTHRPGILIGKGGRTIDALKEYLNKGQFPKPVQIDIKESKMWLKLF